VQEQDRTRVVFLIALLAGSYFALARIGLLTISHPTHIAAIWPAGGLLLGVLLLNGRRRWWWLMLTALLAGVGAELAVGRTVPEAIGFSTAACAESLLAALIVVPLLEPPFRLDAVRPVLILSLAAVAGSCVAAVLGAAVATAGLGSEYAITWLLWWLVSAVGILATTPLVLALADADRTIQRPNPARIAEVTVVLVGLTAVTIGIFTRPVGSSRLLLDFMFPILPFLLWAVLRFGSRGAPFATLPLWAIATAGTVSDRGPFTNPAYGMTDHLLQLQTFMLLACFAMLVGGAIADELRRRQRSLQESNLRLQLEGRALRRAHQELEQRGRLMDLAHDAIIVRDPADSSIDYWNRAAEGIYGYDAEQARGRVVHELLRTEFPDSARAVDAELLERGRWEGEVWQQRVDGQRILVSSRQALQRGENGDPVAVIELNSDITQHRRVEEAKHRLAAMVEHTDDAVIGKRPDGTITEWNRVQGICGSRTDQLVVKSLAEIAHGLGKRTIAEFVANREALELLRDYGIDYAQGFFVAESKPLAEVDLAHAAQVGAAS
jgi:PAS domain S-box-containing protein